MRRADLNELLRIRRGQTAQLREVQELTVQLAQAAGRQDETSVQMLLSMREEPVRRAAEMEASLRKIVYGLEDEDAIRAKELLEGGEAESRDEEPLCAVVGQYRRLLEAVVAADRQLSLRMGDRRSFYRTFRD